MPVQDFECQIARNQIGRYLNGDGLSSEALRQLGSHVAECIGCKGFLDQRKAALQGMLGEAELPVRVEPAPEPEETMTPSESLVAQIKARSAFEAAQQKAAEKRAEREAASKAGFDQPMNEDEFVDEPQTSRPTFAARKLITKPVLYAAALVVVLIAMSYLSRNSSAILGPKVETTATTAANTNTRSKKAMEGRTHPTNPTKTSESNVLATPGAVGTSGLPIADGSSTADGMSTPVSDSEASKDQEQATGTDGEVAISTTAAPVKKVVKPTAKPVLTPTAKPVVKTIAKPAVKPIAKPIAKPKATPAAKRKPALKKSVKKVVQPVRKPSTKQVVAKRKATRPTHPRHHIRGRRRTWRGRHATRQKSGTGTIHVYADSP
jgi:hypothetical protein